MAIAMPAIIAVGDLAAEFVSVEGPMAVSEFAGEELAGAGMVGDVGAAAAGSFEAAGGAGGGLAAFDMGTAAGGPGVADLAEAGEAGAAGAEEGSFGLDGTVEDHVWRYTDLETLAGRPGVPRLPGASRFLAPAEGVPGPAPPIEATGPVIEGGSGPLIEGGSGPVSEGGSGPVIEGGSNPVIEGGPDPAVDVPANPGVKTAPERPMNLFEDDPVSTLNPDSSSDLIPSEDQDSYFQYADRMKSGRPPFGEDPGAGTEVEAPKGVDGTPKSTKHRFIVGGVIAGGAGAGAGGGAYLGTKHDTRSVPAVSDNSGEIWRNDLPVGIAARDVATDFSVPTAVPTPKGILPPHMVGGHYGLNYMCEHLTSLQKASLHMRCGQTPTISEMPALAAVVAAVQPLVSRRRHRARSPASDAFQPAIFMLNDQNMTDMDLDRFRPLAVMSPSGEPVLEQHKDKQFLGDWIGETINSKGLGRGCLTFPVDGFEAAIHGCYVMLDQTFADDETKHAFHAARQAIYRHNEFRHKQLQSSTES